MKIPTIVLLITAIVLTGCGKQEQPDTSVADKSPEVNVPEVVEPAETTASDIKEELITQVESAVESVTESAVDSVKATALSAAASVDWANLSWSDISKVPYNDKDKLVAWAAPQIDVLKDKLAKAAIEKGKLSLSSLSDTGWQGAIKNTASALESVRTSSPETWAMATGALTTAWEALQAEAGKYLGAG